MVADGDDPVALSEGNHAIERLSVALEIIVGERTRPAIPQDEFPQG